MTEFLQNAWYMAAWSHEVGEQPLSRRLVDRKVVLFRAEDGTVVALLDRCPHRFAPLSLGTREGDTLVCAYHGLTFDRFGACVRNAFAEKIPAGARVQAYPVVERDGIAWFWPGDSALADAATILDFSMLAEAPMSKTLHGSTAMKAGYEYGTDNLMDLSHIEFVHKGSFAGAGVIFAGQHKVRQEGETLHSDWWMPKVRAPSHTEGIYPPDLITDHWLEMRWNAPASMYLEIGATPSGAAREGGIIAHQAHILTPETASTTHYFWATTYGTPPGAPDMAPMLRELFGQAFDQEDKPIIEAAYANLEGEDFWALRPVSLGIDQGGTRARRLIETMRKRERGDTAA
ncbi:MAG: aromatic ring-hydroxylating dioxygenase subunit alpha [Caulobacteraceae bacterium]